MTEKITFEDVLDEMMLEEPKPDYEALVRWQQRYPQYRNELAEFFATWSMQGHLAEVLPEPVIEEEKLVQKGVEYAMEILRKQGRLLPADYNPSIAPFAELVLAPVYTLHGQAAPANI